MAKTADTSATEPTFESALARLEAIVKQMDSPTLPLEELITDYEEGVGLVKICETRLKEAEQRIEIITKRAQADPQLAAFDPAAPTEPAPRKNVALF